MRRVLLLAVGTAAALALGRQWVALVWEGILAALVLLLLAVAVAARGAERHGMAGAGAGASWVRCGMPVGLVLGFRRRPADQPLTASTAPPPAEEVVDGEGLIGEIEVFLRSHHSAGD